jgi:hypothetical protein
LFARAF